MTFLRQHAAAEKAKAGSAEPDHIVMRTCRDSLDLSNGEPTIDELLHQPVASFCDDIMTPYSADANLPLIVLCEPFRQVSDKGNMRYPRQCPRGVTIDLPTQFRTPWEGRVSPIDFTNTPPERTAKLVDSVTFFPSGLIAYSVSLIFDATEANILDHDLLLVLAKVALAAGATMADKVLFKLDNAERAYELMPFLAARVKCLQEDSNTSRNIFSWLKDAIGGSVSQMFSNKQPFDRVLVDIEVLGCSLHDRVLEYAMLSEKRQTTVDEFSKALAGLTQNVLDYQEQDAEEIDDSLANGLRIGSDITFVSKALAVKFCKQSRVTREMRHVVGGSPYWMLVQLVMAHNEALLSNLSEAIDADFDHTGMMQSLLDPKNTQDLEASQQRLRQALKRRIRLAYYIPNLFRYPTEQRLYLLYSKARGLELRQEYLVSSEAAWDSAVREVDAVTEEKSNRRLNMILVALGIVQIGGVLAAIAAIDDARFWYFGRHVFDVGAELHALFDLIGGVFHEYSGNRPADFSAVWALAVAILCIAGGSVLLVVQLLGPRIMRLWSGVKQATRTKKLPGRPS
jgi:hypothetical protein